MLRCGRGEKKFQSRKLLSYNNNEQTIKNKRKYTVHFIIILLRLLLLQGI